MVNHSRHSPPAGTIMPARHAWFPSPRRSRDLPLRPPRMAAPSSTVRFSAHGTLLPQVIGTGNSSVCPGRGGPIRHSHTLVPKQLRRSIPRCVAEFSDRRKPGQDRPATIWIPALPGRDISRSGPRPLRENGAWRAADLPLEGPTAPACVRFPTERR